MLYSEIKRETLSHIHRYTVAGKPVSASYNNQADYLNRIPTYINEALVNILTLVKREATVYPLTDGEEYGDCLRYELPDDFYTLRSGGVSRIRDGHFEQTNNYRLQGKKHILIPKGDDGEYTVEYYRYPNLLPLDAKDSFNLKEDIEVIQTATYYAAAQLTLHDDEYVYASLYNDYESRLGRLSPGVSMEVRAVDDAYGFNVG
jgi:hypothetical protein